MHIEEIQTKYEQTSYRDEAYVTSEGNKVLHAKLIFYPIWILLTAEQITEQDETRWTRNFS